jgi:hypothetical protein
MKINHFQCLAVASLNFSEILQYPANKLHRTVTLHGTRGSLKDVPLGSLDLWFKLHATDLRPVHRYSASRRQEETLLATAASDLAALKVDMAADGGLHILQDKSRNRRARPLSAGSHLHKSRQAAVSPSLRGDAKGGRGLLERKRAVQKAQKERPEEEEPEGRKEHVARQNEVPEVKEEKEDKKTLSKAKDPLRKVSRERSKIPQTVQPRERDGTARDVSPRVEQQMLEQHVVASPEIFSQSFNTLIAKSVQPLDNVARTRPKPPRVSKRSVGEKPKTAEAGVLPQQRTQEDAMATEPAKTKEIKSILVKKSTTSVRQDKPSGRRRVSLEEEEEVSTTTITIASGQQQQEEGRAAVATTASTSSRSLEIEETEDEEEEESDDDEDDESSNDEEEEEGSEEDDEDDDDDEETTTAQSSATTTAATTTETTTHLDTEDTSSAAVGGRTAVNRRVVLANVERSGGDTPADSDGVVVSQEQKSLSRKGFSCFYEEEKIFQFFRRCSTGIRILCII